MAGPSTANFVKSLYYDPFKWNIVKSVGFLLLGVAIAREFRGVEVMPPLTT